MNNLTLSQMIDFDLFFVALFSVFVALIIASAKVQAKENKEHKGERKII